MINTKNELEQFVVKNWNDINTFIDETNSTLPIPLYSSVDLRESSTKYAPVDHNIYPAGFNNVCQLDQIMASERIKKYLFSKSLEAGQTVALIPESNTRNGFYLDHLATLKNMLEKGGFKVLIASLDENLFIESQKLDLTSQSNFNITIYPLIRNMNSFDVKLSDEHIQKIDACIMNNDQSAPFDQNWETLETPIYPPAQIGWYKRQKNRHFELYDLVLSKFCEKFQINKNLMQADFETVSGVDFAAKEGLETLHKSASNLFSRLPENKKVFIKASQGTYGMGISVISSADEALNMNRKTRNKMDIGKNKKKFTDLLLQEGVETIVKYEDAPAEISIYLVGGKSTGGFVRANPLKTDASNLNSRGMVYKKFCISEIAEDTDYQIKEAVYSVIARLATTASALEIQEVL